MNRELAISLKIAAYYLIFVGMIGLAWPLIGLGSHHPEFEAQSLAYKINAYGKEGIFNLFFLVAGAAIFFRKDWGRKLGIAVLLFGIFSTANSFAWGVADGEPSRQIQLISLAVIGSWNGIWIFLLAKRSSADSMA